MNRKDIGKGANNIMYNRISIVGGSGSGKSMLCNILSREQVLDLFEIIEFNEIEKDGKTGLGKMKYWHIYNVIAKKK